MKERATQDTREGLIGNPSNFDFTQASLVNSIYKEGAGQEINLNFMSKMTPKFFSIK